jgi:hypothetical protein
MCTKIGGCPVTVFDQLDDRNLIDGQEILGQTLRKTDPVTLSIICKSPECLKILLAYRKDVRNFMKGPNKIQTGAHEVLFKGEKLKFDNLGFALVALSQNPETLKNLLKEEMFFPTNQDFVSFVDACIKLEWERGLRIFLSSSNMHLIYHNLPAP